MSVIQSVAKRCFDITASVAGIVVLSPLLVLIAIAIRFDSTGEVLFRQTRVGRGMRPFEILKFRTMVVNASALGPPLTTGNDPRITNFGRYLRATKLDELPQLFNVLKGDMSLVGPRPEVPRYVQWYPSAFAEILVIRPGLTDLASIKYCDEATLLASVSDPEQEYRTRVLPEKLELAKEYLQRSSFCFDLWVIGKTVARLIRKTT